MRDALSGRATARDPVTIAWAVLVAATLLSWAVGRDHGDHRSARELATVIVLIVAFIKVHLVGRYFMGLRRAPRVLRLLFDGWCVVVCSAIVSLYLTGG